MREGYVSTGTVVAVSLWAVAAVTVGTVWTLVIIGCPQRYISAVAMTTVTSLSVATVWQVRVYAMRICELLRVTSGLKSPDAEVHTIGRS